MSRKKKKGNRKSNARKKKASGMHPLLYEVIGLAMIGLAVIIIFEFGPAGRGLTSLSMFIFGNWHVAIPLLLIVQALIFMISRKMGGWKNRIVGGSLFILASLILFSHVYLFKELYTSQSSNVGFGIEGNVESAYYKRWDYFKKWCTWRWNGWCISFCDVLFFI